MRLPMTTRSLGRSTNVQVSFLIMAFISAAIASNHSAASDPFKDSSIGTSARYENLDSSVS